jgi:UDP-glucose 4-epimerase
LPQNEVTTPLNSKLPYAIVKNVGEAFFRTWKKEYNLDYTLFRFFNTYGPKQSSDFVMSKFIRAALKNEDITIYGDGSQTRTFCYIDDNIEACINALEKNLFVNDVVNIGSDKEMTISQLADIIVKQTNSNSRIIHLPALEEGDMTRRLPDITNMKTLLNRDLTALETGISKVVDEFNKKATI